MMKVKFGTMFLLAAVACSPVSISRMGPLVPSKDRGCDIDVLGEDETPARPYRNVAVIFLRNCPDPETAPCRAWLLNATCEAGGDVVYDISGSLKDGRPDHTAGAMTWTATVAVYAGSPGFETEFRMTPSGEPFPECIADSEDARSPEDQTCGD